MQEIIFLTILKTTDFYNELLWFFSFILVSFILAYFFKQKIFYLLSIIFIFITIFKYINYEINIKNITNLYILNINKKYFIEVIENNNIIYKNQITLNNLNFKNVILKDRGGLSSISGSTIHYSVILNNNKEILSTINSFNGKFISRKSLKELYLTLKNIK